MSQPTSCDPLASARVTSVTEQPAKTAIATHFPSKQEQSNPLAALAFVPLLVVTSPDGGGRWIEEELPACVLFVAVARLHKTPLQLWRICRPPTDSLLSLTGSALPVGDSGK